MRILIVGAGAVGGYFGGRLLQAKRDVTFLVRAARASRLRETGLLIQSPLGDLALRDPPTVQPEALRQPFDLILLSCKAYDLEEAISAFAPAVGAASAVLPLLNGMRHLELLQSRFGAEAVLGGQCIISSALDAQGRIVHLNDLHTLTFGERTAPHSARAAAILQELAGATFEARLSAAITQDMWEKWVFIAALAGITCLMRSTIGDIGAADPAPLAAELYAECAQIASDAGHAPGPAMRQRSLAALTTAGSPLTASMLRDIENGGRTEVDHILGDLLRRRTRNSGGAPSHSLLELAHAHIRAYESRRQRESSG
ncbi:MAG TPA: 2-dehydropantoate 2-reductase [Steroidobacteraceae bacterium]|jgi:2-dehydropantoate 2-reductase